MPLLLLLPLSCRPACLRLGVVSARAYKDVDAHPRTWVLGPRLTRVIFYRSATSLTVGVIYSSLDSIVNVRSGSTMFTADGDIQLPV
jgi:hypothetical protein